jgi:enamine deaminase RidA (YjgF/YER057c/UK114 family)
MMNLKKILVLLIAPLLVILIFVNSVSAQPNRQGLQKQALENPRLPNFTSIFNWGLKLSNIKSWYFFSGIAAQQPNFAVVSPGKYIIQTDYVLNELDIFLTQNKLNRSDIARIEFTLVSGYSEADFNTILGRFASYFQNVKIKPAAGTLRVVNALAFPGLVVEYEVWCVK